MGIFKKHDQPDDDILIFNNIDSVGSDNQEPAEDYNKYFDEDIDFKTGVLKSNFKDIKDNSETLEVIKKKVVKNPPLADSKDSFEIIEPDSTDNIEQSQSENDYESLLEKCKPYTVDDEGNDYSKNDDSLYELMSVAEILKNDQIKSLNNLSKKYNIEIDDQTNSVSDNSNVEDAANEETDSGSNSDLAVNDNLSQKQKTVTFKKLAEQNNFDADTDDQKFEDYILKNNPDAIIEDSPSDIPDLSDIDNSQKLNVNVHDHSSDSATLKYIPVKDMDDSKKHVTVSSITQNIDFDEKLNLDTHSNSKTKIKNDDPKDDFEQFTVKEEITDSKILRSEIKNAAIKKRTSFLCLTASIIISITSAIAFITNIQNAVPFSKSLLIFMLVCFILNCIANYEMVSSFKKIFKKILDADFTATFLSLGTITMSLFMILSPDKNFASEIYWLILISTLLLSARSYSSFCKISSRLGNLNAMSTKFDIYGVSFIDDQSIAYSIAKDSVDGDILIAAPHKTKFVNSFNRYSEHSSILSGRFAPFQIVWMAIILTVGFFGFIRYEYSIIGAMFCIVTLLCILAFPSLFLINSLPCYSASKKLNKIGASIFGTAGAKQLDNANSVIVSTEELFPAGSIVLKDMKILSENSIDDTILRAASLTEAVGSPLTPVFKKIAKTDASYSLPDSDTVKYEDKLGISGWVDNELLFIGNRTLMQSHGIDVPSIEVDKRILRKGYFPIYVATVQKACALLIVKYNPDYEIAKELRKLSGLGVALLFINSDPNINEAMISDYFDIYEDGIKIVSNAGKYMYENSVISKEPMPSPATFKRQNLSFVKIMNCASAIRKSNNLFSIIYIITTIIMAVGFIYLKFSSDNTFYSSKILFLAELLISAFSILLYLFKKP